MRPRISSESTASACASGKRPRRPSAGETDRQGRRQHTPRHGVRPQFRPRAIRRQSDDARRAPSLPADPTVVVRDRSEQLELWNGAAIADAEDVVMADRRGRRADLVGIYASGTGCVAVFDKTRMARANWTGCDSLRLTLVRIPGRGQGREVERMSPNVRTPGEEGGAPDSICARLQKKIKHQQTQRKQQKNKAEKKKNTKKKKQKKIKTP